MSGDPKLARRDIEPPVGGDLGAWAAGEISKHEEICGLRYESIDARMERIEGSVKAINDRFGASVKYVLGILASLGVAIVIMVLNDSKTRAAANDSDKRELRARLSLLTAQLTNVRPQTAVVVTPPGSQAQPIPAPPPMPPDPDDLSAAVGEPAKP